MSDALTTIGAMAAKIFVLSLSTERITELAKRQGWVDSDAFINLNDKLKSRPLSTTEHPKRSLWQKLWDPNGNRNRRSVRARNTFVVGVMLALVTQANAFQELSPEQVFSGNHSLWWWGIFELQIIVTGSASGVGSSFWYDILGVIAGVRQAKESFQDPASAITGIRTAAGSEEQPVRDRPPSP